MTTLPSRYKVYRRCANDYVDEVLVSEHFDPAEAISACDKEMFIMVVDGHSRKLLDAEKILQIRLLADKAEMIHDYLLFEAQRDKTRRGKRLVSKLLADKAEVIQQIASLREVQVYTNDAQQTLVVAAPSDDPEGAGELHGAFNPEGGGLYHQLVSMNLRVGRPIMVLPSGTEEVIRHYPYNRGGTKCSRVIVRRTNGLPHPVSGRAAAIFHHFIKIQYRDVRSLGGHLKTGHRRSPQNRPTGRGQDLTLLYRAGGRRGKKFLIGVADPLHSGYTGFAWAEDSGNAGMRPERRPRCRNGGAAYSRPRS